MKRHVLVLYHRTPYEETEKDGTVFFKENSSPNGIIHLLKSGLAAENSTIWIAGSRFTELFTSGESQAVCFPDTGQSCLLKRIAITHDEINEFYYTTSKEGFWPILHSFPEKFNCSKVNWENFLAINKRFAQAAVEEAKENTIIWIHDYNLWMAPFFIRQQLPHAKIAFFFHTPFPSADIFNVLPWRKQIIESLLCCNLITFAIPRYVENFVATARTNVSLNVGRRERVSHDFSSCGSALSEPYLTREVSFGGHRVGLNATPVGTNCQLISKILEKPAVRSEIKRIREINIGQKIIFAASRLDYIKGIDRLLECYLRLLDRRKQLIGKVVLALVAVDPVNGITVHNDFKRKVKELINEINVRYRCSSWEPILYFEKAFSFEEMICWYAATDIMWVSSLRDGTNLVCKEFLAAKGNKAGVLMLSEFLGAAVELPEALSFNPYSSYSMDNAIDAALAMSVQDQIQRNTALAQRIRLSAPLLWADQLSVLDFKGMKNISDCNSLTIKI